MAVDQAGIMALPENQAMAAPQLSMMDSYEAMQQGLQNARPDASMELEEALAEIRPELDELTDEQLNDLVEAVQGLYGDPENYAKEVADLVAEDLVDAGDLPAEYDEEFLAAFLMVLVDAQRSRMATSGSERAMPEAPMGMAPMGMMPPQGFARGGIAEAARMVANSGRRGDTMLAHITPSEARLLKARGGSGTINPETGLPEFFIKKLFKAVKKTIKRIGKVVKKALSSPIGRILGTIALGMVLGPGAFGITGLGLSAGAAGAAASGLITAATGGNLKDILTSAATGFMGAPGGPVSNFIGKYTGQFLTNPVVREAATGAIVGTASGVVSGQNLKDALKSGLTEGVISGGMAYMSGAPKVEVENAAATAAKDAVETQSYIDQNLPTTQQMRGAATQPAGYRYQLGPDGVTFIDTVNGQPVSTADAARMRLDVTTRKPGLGSQVDIAQGASRNAPLDIPSPTTAPSPPGMLGTPDAIQQGQIRAGQTAGGIPLAQDLSAPVDFNRPQGPINYDQAGNLISEGTADTSPSFYNKAKNLYNEYLSPSGIEKAGIAEAEKAYTETLARTGSETLAQSAYKAAKPGLVSTYGPLVGTGIGTLALAGGFNRPDQEDSEMKKKLSGTPGLDLIKASPSSYLVQGLPGVQYDERGNIIGGQSYSSPYTLSNVRVPSMYANGGIAALAQGGYPRRTGQISGPGTEKSDSIPAMLSDGEFVMTAKAVRGAGGGSRRDGAKRMYALMHQLERNAARG
jgi:hypothetical protein